METPERATRRSGGAQSVTARRLDVALLTGGGVAPYAYGLATALASQGVHLDLIAGDQLDGPPFHGRPGVTFFNLRGNQEPRAPLRTKVLRVLAYYGRLLRYALSAKPRVFHILWNNKFEVLDRTLLMLYYKLLRKKIVLTVHNVNAGWRDSNDTSLNRLTLGVQYRLADHLFVHTNKMKGELVSEFSVRESTITVIPIGIDNYAPNTALTSEQAKQRLAIGAGKRTILFFGNIAPYKGLEYLIAAFERLVAERGEYRLLIAGRPKAAEHYWDSIRGSLSAASHERIVQKIEHVPNEEIEVYFKAADVFVLPYTRIYQSAVLFLGYSFGLPAVVSDAGSLSEDVVEAETGYVFRAGDSVDLAHALDRYFSSELFKDLPNRRPKIRDYAAQRHSWDTVGEVTTRVYSALLDDRSSRSKVSD
jgi:glycosyltransferase involved in cell wall biosynthesis